MIPEVSLAGISAFWNDLKAWPQAVAALSALLSFGALSILIWVNFARPSCRRRRLRVPVNAYFAVHRATHPYPCEYAHQDDQDHHLKTIVLPSHSNVTIDLVFEPAIDFRCSEYYVGCEGAPEAKPVATEYFNRFIAKGSGQRIVPGEGTRDFIDVYGYYHHREEKPFAVGTALATAFRLETKSPGIFPFHVNIPGHEVRGEIRDLTIVVEDSPGSSMKCIVKTHRRRSCRREGIQPRRPSV
jgi:hypothetical protein